MKYIKCLSNSLKYVSMAMAYMLLGYSCSDDISELGDQPIKPKTEYKSVDEAIHPGLCRGVVPTALIMRLNFDAVALTTKRKKS